MPTATVTFTDLEEEEGSVAIKVKWGEHGVVKESLAHAYASLAVTLLGKAVSEIDPGSTYVERTENDSGRNYH
jgi:hypothetical protein